MSRVIAWIGRLWYGLMQVVLAAFAIAFVWEVIMSIWRNPKGFFQGIFLIAIGLGATGAFIRVDEVYSERWQRHRDLGHRVAHAALAFGAPLVVGLLGFWLFRGIWPEGPAFGSR